MKDQRGFSLVEVMIVSAILLSSATGMMALHKQMIDMQLIRFYSDIAVRLAVEKIEDLHDFQSKYGKFGLHGKTSYSQISDNSGGVLPAGKVAIQPSGQSGKTLIFERQWKVFEDPLSASKNVVVTISWQGINAKKQHFSMSSELVPISPHRHIHLTDNYSIPR